MTNMADYRNLTRNILRAYRLANPAEIQAGLDWYDSTFTLCERIAWRHGRTIPQVASALAHTSPRVTFRQNLVFAEALAAGHEKPASCMASMWARGQLAITSDDPLSTFSRTALKTGAFARAILGDRNAVVVDVWAARAAGVGESHVRSTRGYHMVAEAYRRGARRVDIAPRDLQAVTWCHIRGAAA